MYTTFYNLKHKPFQISTDPKFLWLGEKHEEALATLKYGVLDNKGFLLLTGDVGTGKTTLINALLKTLEGNTLVATVRDPDLEPMDFYIYTSHVFGMGGNITSKGSFLIQFERFLLEAHKAKKQVLLIIDEAQRISQELLEEVRLLSNIEKEDTKLLNIFFVGQLEFNDMLLQAENMPIRQRITVNYNIKPLTFSETIQYISHRLKIAGAPSTIFDESALGRIFLFSKGYPRLINIICDRCLLTGFVEETKTISIQQVIECSKELTIPKSKPKKSLARNTTKKKEQDTTTQSEKIEPAKDGNAEYKGMSVYSSNSRKFLYAAGILFLLLLCYFIFPEMLTMYSPDNSSIKSMPDILQPKDTMVKRELKNVDIQPLEENIKKVPGLDEIPKNIEENKTQEKPIVQAATEAPEKKNAEVEENLNPQDLLKKVIIPFPPDSNLPPRNYLLKLDELAASQLSKHDYWIIVTGFTDSSGNEVINEKLSEYRANAIKIYLVGKGLEESRITAQGLGSQFPIAPNDTHEGRIANRRVEIEVKKEF